MESGLKRPLSVKPYFISPYRKIYKPKIEEEAKKPVNINILSSYMRYKKHPLTGDLKQNLKKFTKSLNGKDTTTSLLITMKNFMERKKMTTRNYRLIKKKYKNNNIYRSESNNLKFDKYSRLSSQIFNKRYQQLMHNISFTGNNSQKSFKNISNKMLDKIFKYNPYISFDAENIKVIDKVPDKYKIFFENINNQSKEFNYTKESDLSPKKENIKKEKKVDLIAKKISFENKMLNKLSDQKVFNYIYSDRDNNLYKPQYLEFNLSNETKKENKMRDSNKYYLDFKNLKQKMHKKDDENNKIKNDIKRQQSLTKHKIQVGLVKLNEYKIKLRQYKNMHSKVY